MPVLSGDVAFALTTSMSPLTTYVPGRSGTPTSLTAMPMPDEQSPMLRSSQFSPAGALLKAMLPLRVPWIVCPTNMIVPPADAEGPAGFPPQGLRCPGIQSPVSDCVDSDPDHQEPLTVGRDVVRGIPDSASPLYPEHWSCVEERAGNARLQDRPRNHRHGHQRVLQCEVEEFSAVATPSRAHAAF
jgi:hypothetical protein